MILGLPYGMGIDMWSFGLILVEVFTGYPLFPGQDESEQLACIMEVFGPPPLHMRENCKRRTQFFDSNLQPMIRPNPQGHYRYPSSRVSDTVNSQGLEYLITFFFSSETTPVTDTRRTHGLFGQ